MSFSTTQTSYHSTLHHQTPTLALAPPVTRTHPACKQVTVLFADFSGFTSFSSKLDAEDVRDHMVSLWGRLDAVITSHGGTIEKHIGDAIMAVFGARQAREDDPERAVRTALAMQSCL